MKKQIISSLLLAFLLLVGTGLFFWKAGFFNLNEEIEKAFDAGYFKGYSNGINSKIADYKYWCEDKYGWMPQSACDNDDVCEWLSKEDNRIYGCYYNSCFDWFQEEMYRKGQLYEGALGE